MGCSKVGEVELFSQEDGRREITFIIEEFSQVTGFLPEVFHCTSQEWRKRTLEEREG